VVNPREWAATPIGAEPVNRRRWKSFSLRGTLSIGSFQEQAYDQADSQWMEEVAGQVTLVVDNALHVEHAQSIQPHLQQACGRLSLLPVVHNTVVSTLNVHDLVHIVSTSLRRLTRDAYASLALADAELQPQRIYVWDVLVSKGLLRKGLSLPVAGAPPDQPLTPRQ
jgi:hypothetical protein